MAVYDIEKETRVIKKGVGKKPPIDAPKKDEVLPNSWPTIAPEAMARQKAKATVAKIDLKIQATEEEVIQATREALAQIASGDESWRPQEEFPKYGLNGFNNALDFDHWDDSITGPHDLFEGKVVDLPTPRAVEDVA